MTARYQYDKDLIKSRLPLSELIGRDVTWNLKKSIPAKRDYWCNCPMHGEKTPSFQCTDSKELFYCYGCKVGGDHFDYLQAMHGMNFGEAVKYAAGLAGVGPETALNDNSHARQVEREKYRKQQEQRERQAAAHTKKRQDTAQGIWRQGVKLDDTPAAKYLFNRGGFEGPWPDALRYHPECLYELDGKPFRFIPALICRVDNAASEQIGLWRIFITPNGNKNTSVSQSKVGLGPCKGGAVRLWEPIGGEIGSCEGVETAFGIRALTGRAMWAMLSTSGMAGFECPFEITRVRVFPDGDGYRKDKNGHWQQGPGIVSARQAKANIEDQGVSVVIEPEPTGKADYLDIWNEVRKHER